MHATDEPLALWSRFRTESRHYLYDTGTNQILEVSRDTWERLGGLAAVPTGGSGEGAGSTPESDELAEIVRLGYLAPQRISAMRFYLDGPGVTQRIEHRIPQLALEITEACNGRCTYCPYRYNHDRVSKPSTMDWGTVENAVRVFMEHNTEAGHRALSFWGGEPLVRFDLIRRTVDHIQREYQGRGLAYAFTTNATLITEEIAAFLARHDFMLLVSLDGPSDVHDRCRVDRNGQGTHRDAVAGLRRLKDADAAYYRRRVRINCVLAPGTDWPRVFQYFRTDPLFDGAPVRFTLVSSAVRPFFAAHGGYSAPQVRWLREAIVQALNATGSESDPLDNTAVKRFLQLAVRPRTPMSGMIAPNGCCVPLLKKMLVATNGDIHVCEKVDPDNPVGNVNNEGIRFEQVERLVREYCERSLDECGRCWANRLCTACYRDFFHGGGWQPSGRKEFCERMRVRLTETLEDYATVLERRPDAFDQLKGVTLDFPV